VVDDRIAEYGHVIVDECHHLSAHSFEQVVRQAKARFVVGLSATLARKDGHHPIIFMQCGPVRHQVNARAQAASRPFEHFVLVQPTPARRQLLLPVSDNYFCRRRVSKGVSATTGGTRLLSSAGWWPCLIPAW
jgi:superfamily II DNA or RNA helicase